MLAHIVVRINQPFSLHKYALPSSRTVFVPAAVLFSGHRIFCCSHSHKNGTMSALLRNRGFRLLWTGQFLAILADWTLRTMLLIWVYQLTHSGVAMSFVGLAEALPLLLLAPVAGVFVDRWSRAATMAIAVVARALLLLPLLAVQSRVDFPLIILVTVLVNAAAQFFAPAASAALPAVVGQEHVGQANGLLSVVNSGISVIAPGAGALLFTAVGPHGTLGIMLLFYLIAAPLLSRVPAPRPITGAAVSNSVMADMHAGIAYVRRSPLLLSLIAVGCVALLGVGALSVLDVVFVTRALHLRSETVGLLLTVGGVGQLIGGISTSLATRRIERRYHLLLGVSIILVGITLAGYAIAPNLLVAAALLFLNGLSFPPVMISFMTMIQQAAENEFMGRVMSLVNTSMALAMIVSMTCGGVLTDLFGVRQVIGGGAVVLVVSGVLSLLIIRTTPRAPVLGTTRDHQPAEQTVPLEQLAG